MVGSSRGGGGLLGLRINAFLVLLLMFLEGILLWAYFSAHSAVYGHRAQGIDNLIDLDHQPLPALRSEPSRYSEQQKIRNQGAGFVGASVSAANNVGPLALSRPCPDLQVMNSADPKIWGPVAWWTLHTMSVHYPVKPNIDHRIACEDFLWSLPYMLPCGECGFHLLSSLESLHASHHVKSSSDSTPRFTEVACESRDALIRTMVRLHNEVNEKNGKQKWTPQQVTEHYSSQPICLIDNRTWGSDTSL